MFQLTSDEVAQLNRSQTVIGSRIKVEALHQKISQLGVMTQMKSGRLFRLLTP